MHTLIVVLIGFASGAACCLAGYLSAGTAGASRAALFFLPLWLAGAGINLYLGVKRAGYSFAEELPIFLLVFAIPAAAAVIVWWRLRE